MIDQKDNVSVVIPARESHKTIRQTIQSLLSQTQPPCEIILVCSLQDKTRVPIQDYIEKGFVTYVEVDTSKDYIRDAHFKRWYGASRAKGHYIFFTDAKVILDKNAIQRSVELANENKVDVIAGIAESWDEDKNLFVSRLQDKALITNNPRFPKVGILTKQNFGATESLPVTTALLVSSRAFNAVKDDFGLEYSKVASTYDDYVLSWLLVKNDYNILITNEVVSKHKHRNKLEDYFKQISRSGQSAALMRKFYPECPFATRRLVQVCFYISFVVFSMLLLIAIPFVFGVNLLAKTILTLSIAVCLLGIINSISKKDVLGLIMPIVTFVIIGIFSFHYMGTLIQAKLSKRIDMSNYLQIE